MTAARPMHCAQCDVGVPGMWITADGTHDPLQGGCGGPVRPFELPEGAPQAFGVFAKMDGRLVLQWPPRARMRDALADADHFTPGTLVEVRPLQDAPAPDVAAFMLHIEKLTDLVLVLETRLQAKEQGDAVSIDRARLAELVKDATRLDKLEQLANADGLLLHRGVQVPRQAPGLGLSAIGRTLRQAVDAVGDKTPACRIETYNASLPSPKTCPRCGLGPCQTGATYLKEANQ